MTVVQERYRKAHIWHRPIQHKACWIYNGAVLLISVGLTALARAVPDFAEWYASHIYPIWVSTLGRASGLLPFSLFEFLVIAVILYLLVGLVLLICHLIRRRMERSKTLRAAVRRVITLLTTVLLLFTFNGGINYSRTPFSELNGFAVRGVSNSDLEKLSILLRNQLITYATECKTDETGCSILTCDVNATAIQAMHTLGTEYSSLAGYYPNPKPVLCSLVMSYNNISGVYSPFTIEANYNRLITPYNIPLTVCHELSHLCGFMREDEANFIAYLACMVSDESEFRYSGSMIAFLYVTNALSGVNPELYSELFTSLPKVVLNDYQANNAYWQQFATPIAEIADKVNDAYLKANAQEDGVKSYGRMVDLLVAYYLPE